MNDHIHILGASGSGITSLGAALARSFGHTHLDTDDYYWEPTEPLFQRKRELPQRQRLLGAALDAHSRWVLSESLCGWGDKFIPRFDVVVFLLIPAEIRLARLTEREEGRYGREALAPRGAMHGAHEAFMKWAAAYDEGGEDVRSRRRHEMWMAGLTCPLHRLEGVLGLEEQLYRLGRIIRH